MHARTDDKGVLLMLLAIVVLLALWMLLGGLITATVYFVWYLMEWLERR